MQDTNRDDESSRWNTAGGHIAMSRRRLIGGLGATLGGSLVAGCSDSAGDAPAGDGTPADGTRSGESETTVESQQDESLRIESLEVTPETLIAGGKIRLIGTVSNVGESEQSFTLPVSLSDTIEPPPVEVEPIPPGQSSTFEQMFVVKKPGAYEVTAGTSAAGAVTVHPWSFPPSQNLPLVSVDPGATGYQPTLHGPETEAPPVVRWEHHWEGHDIYSAFVTSDGIGFVAPGNHVDALEVDTGEKIWSTDVEGFCSMTPLLVDDRVYMGTFKGNLYALRQDDGNVVETGSMGSGIEGANRDGDTLYFSQTLDGPALAEDPAVAAFDLDLNFKWGSSQDAWADTDGPPAISGDAVIVAEGEEINSFDASNGERRWRADRPYGGLNVVSADGEVYSATKSNFGQPSLTVYAVETGEVLRENAQSPDLYTQPVVTEKALYVGSGSGVHEFARDTLEERTVYRTKESVIARPTVIGDWIYAADKAGIVYAFAPGTGEPVWTHTHPENGEIRASVTAGGGLLLVTGNDGYVYALG